MDSNDLSTCIRNERFFTAYHEAGHAVADHIFEHGLIQVDIEQDGLLVGGVTSESTDYDTEESAGRHVISLLAGYYAELRTKPPDTKLARGLAGGDFRRAEVAIHALAGGDLASWEQRTAKFVELHWTAIEAVARELLVRDKLDGDQVREIISRITADPSIGSTHSG